MSLNGGKQVGSEKLLSVLVLREGEPVVGAVGMRKSRERFARAVGREGNLLLVFLAFHPTVIPRRSGVLFAGAAIMRCAWRSPP
jgi:hypothetical protein